MPWKETHVEEQRFRFVMDVQEGALSLSALCVEYGISRKTGYLWLERYEREGLDGLRDRSRAPLSHPNRMSAVQEERLLSLKAQYPTWGADKLRSFLRKQDALLDPSAEEQSWPALSTINALLSRRGLVKRRRTRQSVPPRTQPLAYCNSLNSVWSADFKGWFRTKDGQACYPFTLTDNYSRYLLKVQALRQTGFEAVQPLMVAAFREFGLPEAIRTDNGPPFASRSLCRLSRLSVWWIMLGIRPDPIEPGKPQQNGRHERMHRTLKEEATRPPQANLRAQQRCFDRFCEVFNGQRPHAALGQVPPSDVYQASPRRYPLRLREPEYEPGLEVRRVRSSGEIRWRGELHYVSESLIGHRVALEESDDGEWTLWFGPATQYIKIAIWNERLHRWTSPKPEKPKAKT
jgi:transposase InsO family protein